MAITVQVERQLCSLE